MPAYMSALAPSLTLNAFSVFQIEDVVQRRELLVSVRGRDPRGQLARLQSPRSDFGTKCHQDSTEFAEDQRHERAHERRPGEKVFGGSFWEVF